MVDPFDLLPLMRQIFELSVRVHDLINFKNVFISAVIIGIFFVVGGIEFINDFFYY